MTRRRWTAAAVVLVAATCALAVTSGARHSPAAARAPAADTVKVERGKLSAIVSAGGTLTYRARPDGSPYLVVNRARGVYTSLPAGGERVRCGGVLYRVDDRPVLLLCGRIPAYRDLHLGMTGGDVRQLNRNLQRLGYDARAHVRVALGDRGFTYGTEKALRALQRRRGAALTGRLAIGGAAFLPGAARVAKVTGQVGGSAGPGSPVLSATSDRLQVRVNVDPSQQGQIRRGDRAQITLPGNTLLTGTVSDLGRVTQTQGSQGGQATGATVPAFIRLDDRAKTGGLDQAPARVDIATRGVDDALSVPVTALVGRSGGGFAVEVVRPGGRRVLVGVKLGLFDTGGGRVQVDGSLRAGDAVVVPSI